MPLKGVNLSEQSKILTNDELVRLVSLFAEQGVDKIRITGGEPTVKKDIIQVVGTFKIRIKSLFNMSNISSIKFDCTMSRVYFTEITNSVFTCLKFNKK